MMRGFVYLLKKAQPWPTYQLAIYLFKDKETFSWQSKLALKTKPAVKFCAV